MFTEKTTIIKSVFQINNCEALLPYLCYSSYLTALFCLPAKGCFETGNN